MDYRGTLEANLLTFLQQLRQQGLLIGHAETQLALKVFARAVDDRQAAQLALRLVCAKSPLERQQFDALFARFFGAEAGQSAPPPPQLPPKPQRLRALSLIDWQPGDDGERVDTMGYSTHEVQRADDGAIQLLSEQALRRWVARLARYLMVRPSRRYLPMARKGALLDLRRSIRRSLASGGELVRLNYKARALGKSQLVFIFDVSGSMMVYSHFLLQLAGAFVRERRLGRAEAFAFSTDCYRLTPFLAQGELKRALAAAQRAMPGRSGGTKIGYCLEQLLARYGGCFDLRSSVIICSDGWDTGELARLEGAMRALKARSRQIIWLNPLAASPGYAPSAGGMRTALPFVDIFAPAHNPESLARLEAELRRRWSSV